MLNKITISNHFHTNLLQKEDYYYCPECLLHYAAAPTFCPFCGVMFDNLDQCTEVFSREEKIVINS